MFRGLGIAECRLLEIIRPGVPLTVTDARRAYPEFDYRVHRQAMQSLSRKGFVQVVPGKVFAVGTRQTNQPAPVSRQTNQPAPVSRPVTTPAPVSRPVTTHAAVSRPVTPP